MAKGYSVLLVEEIKEANPHLLGVKLAKICVKKEIPVVDVAKFFGVSRMTVYSWFRGKRGVSSQYEAKMVKLIEKLSA